MHAIRYKRSSTSDNLNSLLKLLNDPNCVEFVLFASPSKVTPDYSDSDGGENNLPLVAALAKYTIPGITDVYVLFDGMILSAARRPRYLEVRELLDVAEKSGKAFFFPGQAPFTAAKDAHTAVQTLLGLGNVLAFNEDTRAQYFSHLCSISEANYPK